MLLAGASPDVSPAGPIIRGPQHMSVQEVGAVANASYSPAWSTRCIATTDAEPTEDPAAVRLPGRSLKRSPAPSLSPVLSNPSTPSTTRAGSSTGSSQHVPPTLSVVNVMHERMMAPSSPRSQRKMSSPHSQRMFAEKVAAQLAAAQPAAPPTTLAPPVSCSVTPGVPARSCSRRAAGGSWTSGGHNFLTADLAARTRPRREHDPFVEESRSERSSATSDTAVPNATKESREEAPWLTCLAVGMHRLLGCDIPER